jgi:calcium/calmodulin-dependent protein kinase (CaM kinase) II
MSFDNDARVRETIVQLTEELLVAITSGDWDKYVELCDPSLSAFEPEAKGFLVDGLDFHRFYFALPRNPETSIQSTIVAPYVRVMGDVALIAYVRLTQKATAGGSPITTSMQETRVWQKQGGVWKHVHFHRSPCE